MGTPYYDANLGSPADDAGSPEDGINPAWNDLLNVIPEDARAAVTPVLKSWDQGVQQKIQQVHSDYQPYKFLKEGGVSDEDVRISLGVMKALQEDPRGFYNALNESYGFTSDSEQPGSKEQGSAGFNGDGSQEFNLPPHVQAQLAQLQGGYETMAKILLEKQKQEDQEAADAELDDEIEALRSKYGEFDEGYIVGRITQGETAEEAYQAYQQLTEYIITNANRPKAPRLLGSGSGIPGTNAIDPRTLNEKQTKDAVVNILMAAAQNQD